MDTPLSRGEHQEYKKAIDAEIKRLDSEDKRLSERLKAVEGFNVQLTEITKTLQMQSDNIGEMNRNLMSLSEARKEDSERLEKLEGKDGEMWRKVVGYVVTAIVGIVVGFLFKQIGM